MNNPLVSARVEVPADCPMNGEIAGDGVHFTIGSTKDALDIPVDLVFARDALRRFVSLANELLAESEPAAPDRGSAP